MTTLRDGPGLVSLPDDLRVALCHLCTRWAASDGANPGHRSLVRALAGQGLLMRLSKHRHNDRPICVSCYRVICKVEACCA